MLDDKKLNPVEQYLIQRGATALIDHIGKHADSAQASFSQKTAALAQKHGSYWANNLRETKRAIVEAPAFEGGRDTGYLLYGFVNGAVDVFPSDSLPDLCRDNSTNIYDTVNDIFIDWDYDMEEDDVEFAEDIQQIMQFPYGFTFSCFFATQMVFFSDPDPMADGEMTEDEALAASVVLVNEMATNVLYNLGYMY